MANRIKFLICVLVLIAGASLANGTNDGVEFVAPQAIDIAEARVDPAVYDSLVGIYDYGKLRVLRVTRDGNHLFAQFAGRNCEIFPKSETEYFWKVMDAQITFVKDGRGKVIKAVYHEGNRTIVGSKIVSLELFWLSCYGRWFGAVALLYALYIGIGVSIRDRVPFQIMREFFHSLPRNFAACFKGWNIAWHFAAIGLGVVLATSGFDWFYLSATRNPQLLVWMIPGIDLGVWVPLALPPSLLLAGIAFKKAPITRTGWALAQVALIGFVLTELIKAVTGRPQPPLFLGPDTSHVFHFGLLRSEMVSGWPSGHTIIAFAMSVTLFWLFPQKKWLGAVSLLYAFYVGLSVSMTVHWFSDFASGIIFGIVVGTTVGRSFAAMDFPSRGNGVQNVPQNQLSFNAMAIQKEQSHKYSFMAALLFGLIWIAFLPVVLIVGTAYVAHRVLSSRKLGVSATAFGPMSTRWMQHQLGLRGDEACAKLIKVLPNHSYAGLYVAAFPVLLSHRLTGFVPKSLRYPYEGIPPVQHQTHVRSTFVDATIEMYLPGVEQFVVLGAGYDTRTVQLQHNQRIRCFEVDLPKTQQLKLKLLHQCGVDTSGVTFVSANFLTDNWLDNLVKAGFDPRKPTYFLWEGVTYYLSREGMEETFRTIATTAPGSVVVFDYATDAVIKMHRKPLGRLHKAILKVTRESQTFWIPSEPPVKETLATLMDSYGLSLREHLSWGHETKRKPLPGGLAAAVVK